MQADDNGVLPQIGPQEEQIHNIYVDMVGQHQGFTSIVIMYRYGLLKLNNLFRIGKDLEQIKVRIPLVITKFMSFRSISAVDFNLSRKGFLNALPNNNLDSDKIRLSAKSFDLLKNNLFGKLTYIPTDGKKNDKFTLLGGCFTLDDTETEFYLRVIIEKDTRLAMYQVTFEEKYRKFAERISKVLALISSEKILSN